MLLRNIKILLPLQMNLIQMSEIKFEMYELRGKYFKATDLNQAVAIAVWC